MKRTFKILSFLLVLTLAFTLIGCSKPVELDAPKITIEEGIVSWSAVENASKYLVNVNDDSYESTTTSYDLTVLKESKYSVTVVAVGDDKDFTNSKPSNKVVVTPEDNVELQKVSSAEGKLKYNLRVQAKEDAIGFEIVVSFLQTELALTEDDVKFVLQLPSDWVSSYHVENGKVHIALVGTNNAFNVRFAKTLLTLEFDLLVAGGEASVTSFEIEIMS